MRLADPPLEPNPGQRFEHAFQRLMSRAPGPVFPRARRLYFDKYPLEGLETVSPFHTHLLEETIQEGADGALSIAATAFALVPRQPTDQPTADTGGPDPEAGARYLQEQWQQQATELVVVAGPWFRTKSAYLRAAFTGNYNTGGATGTSFSRAGQ